MPMKAREGHGSILNQTPCRAGNLGNMAPILSGKCRLTDRNRHSGCPQGSVKFGTSRGLLQTSDTVAAIVADGATNKSLAGLATAPKGI